MVAKGMRRGGRIGARVAAVVAMAAVAASFWPAEPAVGQAGKPPAPAAAAAAVVDVTAEPDGTLEQMEALAEQVVKNYQMRAQAGEPMPPSFIEARGAAFRRLLAVRRELARSRKDVAGEIQALEANVEHARDAHRMLVQRAKMGVDASQISVSIAATDLAEAKYRLAQAKAGVTAGSNADPASR